MGIWGIMNLYGIVFATLLIGLILVTSNITVVSSENDKPAPQKETIMFIDKDSPSHYGKSCDDSVETDRFKFIKGGVKWNSFPVTYKFDSSVPLEHRSAITAGFEEWDDHEPMGIDFFKEDSSSFNTISFRPIDQSGGTIATASLTFSSAKVMLIFRITFDSNESWDSGLGSYDVQNIAAHEAGHVVGLDHRNSSKDCLLTMFRFVQLDETDKRDLAIGDIEGVTKLYS